MKKKRNLSIENKELKARLVEAEELLAAIKRGEVDAFITDDQQVFTLKSADHAYRVLVETINEGAATLTLDGTMMYCNLRLANMLGMPIEKIIGSSVFDLVGSNELPKLKSALRQCENSTVRSEFQLKKFDGTFLPVLVSCNSLKVTDTSLCMVITDLTEQKKNERELEKHRLHLEDLVRARTAELRDSEARYRRLFESAKDGILILDFESGLIVDVNPFLTGLLGYSREELCKKHLWEIGFFEDIASSKESFSKLQTSNYVRYEDLPLQMKDGEKIDVEFVSNVYLVDHKKVIQCNIRDITLSKRAKDILKRDKQTMEKLVQEQAQKLAEAQIEIDRAARLSDIGILAATVAHELRNPLAAIQMATHNIKRKAKNPDIDKHLVNIEKKVGESDQIINNLLFYSRLKTPHFETIDIYNIIEECVEVFDRPAKKEVTVTKVLDPIKDILIEADPFQIKEVFHNILNNAHDAVPQEKGEIKIVAENEDEFVKVGIEDNGPGIAKDIIDKIFDPFFTTKAKGTGLGLSVCRQIVTIHEGEITVEHGFTKGTSIFVRLPKERKKE